MKVKSVTNRDKQMRPISLTPALSKLAEDFIVNKYIGPAVLEVIDPNQYGVILKTSTLQALISMVHTWAQATDGTGSAIRVLLLDYRKAFDLVDHSILAAKILELRIPRRIARWVCDFLMDRRQRVNIPINNCALRSKHIHPVHCLWTTFVNEMPIFVICRALFRTKNSRTFQGLSRTYFPFFKACTLCKSNRYYDRFYLFFTIMCCYVSASGIYIFT